MLKKRVKSLLCIITAFTMLTALIPSRVFAEELQDGVPYYEIADAPSTTNNNEDFICNDITPYTDTTTLTEDVQVTSDDLPQIMWEMGSLIEETVVSDDGKDVPTDTFWATQEVHYTLHEVIAESKEILSTAASIQTLENAISNLQNAIDEFKAARMLGTAALVAPDTFTSNREVVLHLRGENLPEGHDLDTNPVTGLAPAREVPSEVAVNWYGGVTITVPDGEVWEHWRGLDIQPVVADAEGNNVELLKSGDRLRVRIRNTGNSTNVISIQADARDPVTTMGTLVVPAGETSVITITITEAHLEAARTDDSQYAHYNFRIRGSVIDTTWEIADVMIDRSQATMYTVNFNLNGGTHAGGGELTQQIEEGTAATPPTVTRDGYNFAGWASSPTGVTINNITTDVTFTAQWEESRVAPNAFTQTRDIVVLHLRDLNLQEGHNFAWNPITGLAPTAENSNEVQVNYYGGITITVPSENYWYNRIGMDILPRFNWNDWERIEILPYDILRIRIRNTGYSTNTISVQADSNSWSEMDSVSVPAGETRDIEIYITEWDLYVAEYYGYAHNNFRISSSEIGTTWEIADIMIERELPPPICVETEAAGYAAREEVLALIPEAPLPSYYSTTQATALQNSINALNSEYPYINIYATVSIIGTGFHRQLEISVDFTVIDTIIPNTAFPDIPYIYTTVAISPQSTSQGSVLSVPSGRTAVFHLSAYDLTGISSVGEINGIQPAGDNDPNAPGTFTLQNDGSIRVATGLRGYAGTSQGIDVVPEQFGGLQVGDEIEVLIELVEIVNSPQIARTPVNNGFRIESSIGYEQPAAGMSPASNAFDWQQTPLGFRIAAGAVPTKFTVPVTEAFIADNNYEWAWVDSVEQRLMIGNAEPPRFRIAGNIATAWVDNDGFDGLGGSIFVIHDILIHREGSSQPQGLTAEEATAAGNAARNAALALIPTAPLANNYSAAQATALQNSINALNIAHTNISISATTGISGTDPNRFLVVTVNFAVTGTMLPNVTAPAISPIVTTLAITPQFTPQPTPTTPATITVTQGFARPSETTQVGIRLDRNPGFAGMFLRVELPQGLTLVSYEVTDPELANGISMAQVGGGVNIAPNETANIAGTFFVGWVRDTDFTAQTGILMLNLLVASNAENGNLPINVTLSNAVGDNIPTNADGETLDVTVRQGGGVTVRTEIKNADANGDNRITSADGVIIARYIVGHVVTIDKEAADLNGDGKVDTLDLTILGRWLVGIESPNN